MKTLYGQGVDWPITYDDLEPFYGEAENEIGVAGDSALDLGSPRSTPFPMSEKIRAFNASIKWSGLQMAAAMR